MSTRDIIHAAAGASSSANYTDEVFSTYLYTGTGATQTINNGIDLAGSGGMVWIKGRSGATDNAVYDTVRGATYDLVTSSSALDTTESTGLTSFSSTGFSIGTLAKLNSNFASYASWTFRKAPTFFDIVTYTGDGTTNRAINHSLGISPGMVIVKTVGLSPSGDWIVYHASLGTSQMLKLNSTAAATTAGGFWGSSTPTSTSFYVGTNGGMTNNTGETYVAYVFAHDTATTGFIKCGSFNTDASGAATVNLGWEPQYVLIKRSSGSDGGYGSSWTVMDSTRGMTAKGSDDAVLFPDRSDSEFQYLEVDISPTGFSTTNEGYVTGSSTFVYMAIRRPMKIPTLGTSVFSPNISSGGSGTVITTNFPIDLQIASVRAGTVGTTKHLLFDRLRGVSTTVSGGGKRLMTHSTNQEISLTNGTQNWSTAGYEIPSLFANVSSIYWNFKRAPGFFDIVCYTGTGVATTINHNLGVVPELIIGICRSIGQTKVVGGSIIPNTNYLVLNSSAATASNASVWNNTSPTSSQFTVGGSTWVNLSAENHVAYLFATCPGVSKIFSYTGNGTSQNIDCGFSTGARFVLIKATSTTGDWYVWDTARGIIAANDPYLTFDTFNAEVTSDDSIDPYSPGFIVSNAGGVTNINTNGVTYIGLAIA